jgi:hypothetical protein
MPPGSDRRGPGPGTQAPAARSADLEKKLDRLMEELEELRKEIRRR